MRARSAVLTTLKQWHKACFPLTQHFIFLELKITSQVQVVALYGKLHLGVLLMSVMNARVEKRILIFPLYIVVVRLPQ